MQDKKIILPTCSAIITPMMEGEFNYKDRAALHLYIAALEVPKDLMYHLSGEMTTENSPHFLALGQVEITVKHLFRETKFTNNVTPNGLIHNDGWSHENWKTKIF